MIHFLETTLCTSGLKSVFMSFLILIFYFVTINAHKNCQTMYPNIYLENVVLTCTCMQ